LHDAHASLDAGRRVVDVFGPAARDGRFGPALRTSHVDEAARGEEVPQRASGFFVDLTPRGFGDRSELTEQVVHRGGSLRRSPMESPLDSVSAAPSLASAMCSTWTIGSSVNR